MSEIANRYRRLSGDFITKVAEVSPERWNAPSPCAEWTARDVVRHIVDVHGLFLGLVGRSFEPTIRVDDDPLGAVQEAVAIVQADLDDPQRASDEFDGFFGRMSFAAAIDRFICFDLAVHGWDLARGADLDETMRPDEVVAVRAAADGFGDALRQSGVCGPPVDVAPDADDQTKLLALLGRHV
jgi:uncharacterized protein (TIGR03086 family)